MASKASVTFNDYDNEASSVNLRGVDLTSANFDAQVSLLQDVIDAMLDVTIATKWKHTLGLSVDGARIKATSPFAQRETKWLVVMSDANGNPSTLEIPGADLAQLGAADQLDITAGNGLVLKNAIEAFHKSNAGEDVTVLEVRHVGRNI